MAISIVFNSINTNTLHRNGSVAVGENVQSGWSSHQKQDIAQFGGYGINFVTTSVNTVIDNDVIDTPINDNDITTSAQGQAI